MKKIDLELSIIARRVGNVRQVHMLDWQGYVVDGAPGLAVVKTPRRSYAVHFDPEHPESYIRPYRRDRWQVIHIGSGALVSARDDFLTRAAAVAAARRLAQVAVWTGEWKALEKLTRRGFGGSDNIGTAQRFYGFVFDGLPINRAYQSRFKAA